MSDVGFALGLSLHDALTGHVCVWGVEGNVAVESAGRSRGVRKTTAKECSGFFFLCVCDVDEMCE